MTYAVVWSAFAIQELARLQAAVDLPDRIHQAANAVDVALRRYPADVGESRVPRRETLGPHLRVWYGDVLGVLYRVDDVAMRVEVIAVGPARRR